MQGQHGQQEVICIENYFEIASDKLTNQNYIKVYYHYLILQIFLLVKTMELIQLVRRRKVKEAIKQVEKGAILYDSDEVSTFTCYSYYIVLKILFILI